MERAAAMEEEMKDLRHLGEYDSITTRTFTATVSSLIVGAMAGGITATWRDVPVVHRNDPMPGLKKTLQMTASWGATFAAVGGTFAFVDAMAEHLRGKKDVWNGVLGSFAAGGAIGLRYGRLPLGLGSGAVIAAASAFLDLTGQRLYAPTGKDRYAYPRQPPLE